MQSYSSLTWTIAQYPSTGHSEWTMIRALFLLLAFPLLSESPAQQMETKEPSQAVDTVMDVRLLYKPPGHMHPSQGPRCSA